MTAAVCFFWFLGQGVQPARAETERIIIEMSVYGQMMPGDLTTQAESMASDLVSRHFSQSASSSEVEVVIVGDRHGEIVPILTTAVSRTQWQENPQVSAWTRYYNASHALLQRHEETENTTIASSSGRSGNISPVGISSLGQVAQIDAAFDQGRLTGVAAQPYLSYLD
ncbi:hypothetical protein [Pseudanabaena sp. FACHB-2040]|uniref:hypothetical protein n=1 Tax=Pseudanabaena sp. FACHB-2040 TaxID=2692859 RepID=UPI001686EC43|nr:hypothetical protein [Pseudanabaena sp. FACHB-2040]MBD2260552.1 hypothetical protein [Pseudanabaena sp. FACHB-2040]